jgi:site-specific DNA recombinase
MRSSAVYLRVSTEEQRERQSIDTQRDWAGRYFGLHEITCIEWYMDNGVAGTVAFEARLEGARLLRDARAGLFGTLYVYRLDSWGGNRG